MLHRRCRRPTRRPATSAHHLLHRWFHHGEITRSRHRGVWPCGRGLGESTPSRSRLTSSIAQHVRCHVLATIRSRLTATAITAGYAQRLSAASTPVELQRRRDITLEVCSRVLYTYAADTSGGDTRQYEFASENKQMRINDNLVSSARFTFCCTLRLSLLEMRRIARFHRNLLDGCVENIPDRMLIYRIGKSAVH